MPNVMAALPNIAPAKSDIYDYIVKAVAISKLHGICLFLLINTCLSVTAHRLKTNQQTTAAAYSRHGHSFAVQKNSKKYS